MEDLREIEAWLRDEMASAEIAVQKEPMNDLRQWWYGLIEGYRGALMQVEDALTVRKAPK